MRGKHCGPDRLFIAVTQGEQNCDWGRLKREWPRTEKRQKRKLKPMTLKPNSKNKSSKNQRAKTTWKFPERPGENTRVQQQNWQTMVRRSRLLCCSWLALMWTRWADDRGRAGVSWSGTWGELRERATAANSSSEQASNIVIDIAMLKSPLKPVEPFKLGGTGLSFTSWNN